MPCLSGVIHILICNTKIGEKSDMAKVAIKSEKLSPFGGFFSIMAQFDSKLSSEIDSPLGMSFTLYGYQYSEIIRWILSDRFSP